MNALLPPLVMLLLRWTLLFSLAWAVSFLLRRRQARARQLLWRGILLATAAIIMLPLLPLPRLQLNVGRPARAADDAILLPAQPTPAPAPSISNAASSTTAALQATAPRAPMAAPIPPASRRHYPFTLGQTLLVLWAAGAAVGISRLAILYMHLRRLRANALPVDPQLTSRLTAAQKDLHVRRRIDIRVSPHISTPFLTGIRHPVMLIPAALAADLSSEHRDALFAHEVAHVRRQDIAWCTAFRGMLALLWFHPLFWKMPAAHELACEQEADRLAAGTTENVGSYARALAQLALRIVTDSPPEFRLALGATSQIALRLESLKHPRTKPWNRRSTIATGTIAMVLFLLAGGCELTTGQAVDLHAPVEFKKVLVVVQDESGKPVEGAVVTPTGFRVKGIHSADAYSWNNKRFGPPAPATADADGKAWVSYPVMGIPEEQELTGAVTFHVDHAGFCMADVQTFYIDSPNDPVVMKRSGTLDVEAFAGDQQVIDVVANLSGSRATDWEKTPAGHLLNSRIEPGEHILQLMGRLNSGDLVFSAAKTIHVEREKIANERIEMSPGIRVEGRIDPAIPRPIVNGHVFISVRPPQIQALPVVNDYYAQQDKYGYMTFWHTWRTINPDGTFVFESVPPGEADIAALGDGFVSKSQGEFRNRMPDGALETKNATDSGFIIPQAFPLTAPRTAIALLAEPSATLQVSVNTREGKPVQNAVVYSDPNIVRMGGGGLFGKMRLSSESPFKTPDPLPTGLFTATTDKDGNATIRNLPGSQESFFLEHADFQLELQSPNGIRNRIFKIKLSPGITATANLTVESKGFSFIGLH